MLHPGFVWQNAKCTDGYDFFAAAASERFGAD